jgi:hypothetical protein
MSDTRQFALAEAATSAAWARYAMRSVLDATQFAQRYDQVIGAVARRQVTPQQVEQALAESANWTAVAHEVANAIAAFADSLSQCALLPHEHAVSVSDERDSKVQETSDRHRADADTLTALLSSLAQADVTAGARRRALTRLHVADANHTLGAAATAWFTMLDAVSGATVRAMSPALLTVLRAAQPIGYHGQVIELHGPITSNATTVLEIENTLERPALLRCTCHDVRRADGIGPAFRPAMTVTPAEQVLDAGTEGRIMISVSLDDAQFDAQVLYVGALAVESDGGSTLQIPLRINTFPASA